MKTAPAAVYGPSLWARMFSAVALRVLRVKVVIDSDAASTLAKGRALVCANHVSLLDGVLVALASPKRLVFGVDTEFSRRSRAAAAGMQMLSLLGFGAVIPIDEGAPFGIRGLRRVLANGGNVMIFPEGQISPDGSEQSHRPGVAWLCHSTGAEVVKVTISGAEQSRLFAKAGTAWWPAVRLKFERAASVNP